MTAKGASTERSSWLQGWRQQFTKLGPSDALLYATSRALEKISRGHARLIKYHLVAQPIPGSAGGALRADANSPVGFAGPASPLVAHFPRPAQVIRQRYESGAICLAAELRGRFAGFLWLRRDGYEEDEVRCSYLLAEPDRSVWDFDVYVEPRYRLGRTMARLWQAADRHLTSQGVRWSFSRISAFNASSLAAHQRLGLVKCHTATFLRVGPLQLALLPQLPFLHASFRDRQRPTIRLYPPRVDAGSPLYRPQPRP
jgi:hypothetical protein